MLILLQEFDYWLFNIINSQLSNNVFDIFFVSITDLHKTLYFKLLFVPFILFLFIRKFKLYGGFLFFMLVLVLSFSDFIGAKVKTAVERSRPEFNTEIQVIKRSHAGHFSFYSNHATNMFTFATYTSHFLPQAKLPLYALAVLVGYSRIYNGVHYPSDVFAGGFVGYIWGLVFSKLAEKLLIFLKKRKSTE